MCGGASVILHAAQLERRFFPCPRARYKLRARIATSLHSVCPKKKKKHVEKETKRSLSSYMFPFLTLGLNLP